MCPSGRHKVDRLNGSKCDDVFISAGITYDANGLDRQEHGKRLTDLFVEPRLAQFFQADMVRLPQQISLFLLHFSQNSHT